VNFRHSIASAATAVFLIGAGAAQANTVIVTPGGAWTNPAGENGDGTGSSAITNTVARDGNGSIELHGDRTRFVLGDLYSPASNLGALSNYADLAFDWRIAGDSNNPLNADYSPALRLTFWYDKQGVMTKDEFVWEAAYNGLYGAATVPDTWYSTTSSSTFYLKSLNSENTEKTLSEWLGGYGSEAYVSAIYIGVGSSASASYHAFADNVVANGTTYNFETASTGGGVPEPATWAMMVLGFGAVGSMVRGQRRRSLAA
jgi:hypothetical protein